MVLPNCLKRRHSLNRVRLVATITRIRGGQPQSLKEFARFQKDKKMNDLSMDDLKQQTPTISGNSVNVQRSGDNMQISVDNVQRSGDNNHGTNKR
ncbi:Hypothetical predicted protein [Mytilus galloprovincialis]|uniref:Uncharacterized protein n=1 Tax=Mytilus galloprovincialis TaxID=29158 RepID=A0A8B6EQU7_MYTGA|nr:Hypothetical predicted protein [Mytilus galloprovincialis]